MHLTMQMTTMSTQQTKTATPTTTPIIIAIVFLLPGTAIHCVDTVIVPMFVKIEVLLPGIQRPIS